MKLQLASVAFFAVTTCATSDSGCSNDNCARAVTGTQLGDFHPSIARVDCSSFFQKTTTPVATIYTTEVLATTTQTIQAKRQIPTPGIPFYARVCTKPGSYVSACSCLGVLPHTTTAATSTVTIVTNASTTLNYTLPASKSSSSISPICTNTLSDALNCGTCGNVCPSGIYENGSCTTSSCVASTCGAFQTCNGNDNCFCFSSTRSGFCGANALCDGLSPCTTDVDCVAGSTGNICTVGSCCSQPGDAQPGVCLQASCGNPASKLKMMARAKIGRTAAF